MWHLLSLHDRRLRSTHEKLALSLAVVAFAAVVVAAASVVVGGGCESYFWYHFYVDEHAMVQMNGERHLWLWRRWVG